MLSDVFKQIILDSMDFVIPEYTERDVDIPEIENMSISITGARRSGKTYRTYQYMEGLIKKGVNRNNICRIQFNDHRIVSFPPEEFHAIDQAYYSLFPEKRNKETIWFIFDEIHRIDGWEDYILYLLDNSCHKVLITGSTSKLLKGDISTALRGKNYSFPMYPFSFQEFLRHYRIKPDSSSSKGKSELIHYFERYLSQGGFPGLLNLPHELHLELLQSYWDSMILNDIIEAHPDDKISIVSFTQFYKSLLSRISRPMSINNIAKELKQIPVRFSVETIYRYLDYLKEAFLVYTVEIFSESEAVRIQNYKKLYTVDWALGYAVSPGINRNITRAFENLIFLELKRRGYNISYYKTRQGYELDFVALKPGEVHPMLVQVCYNLDDPEVREREERALLKSAKYLHSGVNYIISGNYEEIIKKNNIEIHILPAWKWLISP